jgi:hypothetical protein
MKNKMKTLYYVEEKEITKLDTNNNFEYVCSDLNLIRVYEIKGEELKQIHFVKISDSFDVEEELREDMEWKEKIKSDENIKFVKL